MLKTTSIYPKKLLFKSIKVGELFRGNITDNLYIKINEEHYTYGSKVWNSYNITNKELKLFSYNSECIACPNYELIIKE